MKGFYIENFVLRLLFCIVGMFAIWRGAKYLSRTFILHEPFTFGVIDVLVPLVTGVIETFSWKPKN